MNEVLSVEVCQQSIGILGHGALHGLEEEWRSQEEIANSKEKDLFLEVPRDWRVWCTSKSQTCG